MPRALPALQVTPPAGAKAALYPPRSGADIAPMTAKPARQDPSLPELIRRDGFAFVPAAAMRRLLTHHGSLADWPAFAASWNDLELDRYEAERGRRRRRRHAVFSAGADGPIRREPHQPHYQSSDYNPLHGGIERWFEPVRPEIAEGQSLTTLLAACRALFSGLAPATRRWHIELHQFRIEARPGQPGSPTPEGAHRDGVDYVLVLMVQRRNIRSGTTSILSLDRQPLGSFTLTQPFDAAWVEDARVYHGVTAVEPVDPAEPAYRDVAVITFRKA